jgi:hypothetical protein
MIEISDVGHHYGLRRVLSLTGLHRYRPPPGLNSNKERFRSI